jgi:hypothetical protein
MTYHVKGIRMQSHIIFQNQHYTASAMRDGSLIVERNRVQRTGVGSRRGICLKGEQAAQWVASIQESAVHDKMEAHALCRALVAEL